MDRTLIFCSLAALSFSIAACGKDGSENGREEVKPVSEGTFTVSVTSYNVLGTYSKAAWEPRQDAVKGIITREDHDPDVIAFQECNTEPIKSSLPRMLIDTYSFHSCDASNCDAYLIAWKKDKYSLVESGYTNMLQNNASYGGSTPGGSIAHWVRLKETVSGAEFLVYDIHVKTNSSSTSYQKLRYDCITGLCPAAKFRAKHSGGIPVLICGDFNNYMATVDNGVISAPAACIECGFTDCAAEAQTRKNFFYKTSGVDMENGKLTQWTTKDSRIDFVFADAEKGFTAESYQTVVDLVPGSTLLINKPVPSDHNPVNAVITFKY